MNNELKPLNFFLVLCKTKSKIKKYMKINKITKKYIIDIKEMMDELELTPEEVLTSNLFKIQLQKVFKNAIEKNRDIYYIPNFNMQQNFNKIFNIKTYIKSTHNFNLLYFYEDFDKNSNQSSILNDIDKFDLTQILKDY